MAMLVPEKREEITTEGGLDVAGQKKRMKDVVARFKDAGIIASAFIDAENNQIDAAAECGFDVCEIHTGPFAQSVARHRLLGHEAVIDEVERIAQGGMRILDAGMQFNAGHGLNYVNVVSIASLAELSDLHIGHSIVSRSVFVGMREAVREMKRVLERQSAF
jgi:pyridoxine 5-phosphate synthase